MGHILLLHNLPLLPRTPLLRRQHQTAPHRTPQAAGVRDGRRPRELRVRAGNGDFSDPVAGGVGRGVWERRAGGEEGVGGTLRRDGEGGGGDDARGNWWEEFESGGGGLGWDGGVGEL